MGSAEITWTLTSRDLQVNKEDKMCIIKSYNYIEGEECY